MRYCILLLCVGNCFAHDFFPSVRFDENAVVDQIQHEWFSAQLAALQEPRLEPLPDGIKEAYRFTLLRSSGHPVVFRLIVCADDTFRYVTKVADGKGGANPGRLFRDEEWVLDPAAGEELAALFERHSFFDLPTTGGIYGADGTRWLLEANVRGKYHVVTRLMPSSGAIAEIGKKFVVIAVGDFRLEADSSNGVQ